MQDYCASCDNIATALLASLVGRAVSTDMAKVGHLVEIDMPIMQQPIYLSWYKCASMAVYCRRTQR